MLTVWGRRSSSNVQAVMWCIGELDIKHLRIDAGFKYGVIDSEEYIAMNPNGTVPMIRDGENAPLWESGAILRYLASRYAGDGFWPSNPIDRAEVDQWAEWSKLNIAMMFTGPIFWRVARTPIDRQVPEIIGKAISEFEAALLIADCQLQRHAYIAGPNFTLADIQFAHVLYRYYDLPIDRAPLRAVEQYYRKILKRSPYIQHVAISYDELVDTM